MRQSALRLLIVMVIMLMSGLTVGMLFAADASEDNCNLDFKGTVNINTADKEELQRLYNIGPRKAESIIEYRESFDGFEKIEDIMKIKGIGASTFEMIKDHITVEKETLIHTEPETK